MSHAEVLTALADPTRRSIFESLREGPKTVGELAEEQPVSRPAVSQHLRVLEGAQLVSMRPQGNRRLYLIDTAGLDQLRTYLDGFWDEVLGAYGAEVEKRMAARAKAKRAGKTSSKKSPAKKSTTKRRKG